MYKKYIQNLVEKDKRVFIFSICILISIAIDSAIVKTYGYSGSRLPGIFDLICYSIFVIIFIGANYIFLKRSRDVLYSYRDTLGKQIILHKIMLISQFIISLVLVTIILQMLFYSYYFNNFLIIIVYLSLILSIFFSMLLIIKLVQWFRFNKNRYLLLYVLAFFLILLKSTIAIIYLVQELDNHNDLVKIQQTRSMIMKLTNANAEISNILKNSYDNLSILSYIGIWLTMSLMLKKYSTKLGKTKYWILISIPLTGFFILENISRIPILKDLSLINPNFYGVFNIILFSIFQIILAFLFSFGIIQTSRIINIKKLSSSLIVAAIGIMTIIGSQEIFGTFVGGYPPYGLVTISFMGLGSYMLFLGIITSSKSITTNIKIRDEIVRNIENSNLLKDAGITQWTLEIEKHIKKISKSFISNTKRDELDSSELKTLINDIIEELKKNKHIQDKKK